MFFDEFKMYFADKDFMMTNGNIFNFPISS